MPGAAQWDQSVRTCTRRRITRRRLHERQGWTTTWKYDYFEKWFQNFVFFSPSSIGRQRPLKQLLPSFHILYMNFLTNHKHIHTDVWGVLINVFSFMWSFDLHWRVSLLFISTFLLKKNLILYLNKTWTFVFFVCLRSHVSKWTISPTKSPSIKSSLDWHNSKKYIYICHYLQNINFNLCVIAIKKKRRDSNKAAATRRRRKLKV